jgi:hypothetical protein
MVYDTGFRKKPFPHRCGAILDHCILDENRIIYFCSLCRLVIGYQKGDIKYMKTDEEINSNYKQKQYSDKTIKDSQ